MAGGIQTTGSLTRLLERGVRDVFDQVYDERTQEWPKIFDSMTSEKNQEIDVQFESFAAAVFRDQGANTTYDSAQQGYTPRYVHKTAALGFQTTMEAQQDDLYGVLKKQSGRLGYSMRQLKEITCADVLNNGFDSNFIMPDGDGSPLFDSSHLAGPSGLTYSNQLDVPADLSESSLEDLVIQIGDAVDTRGNQVHIKVIRAIIPSALDFEMQRILGSVLQNDTANNATNALRDKGSIPDGYTVNHYLDDPDAWFLKTNSGEAGDGLTYFQRMAIKFDEDNAFDSDILRMKAVERYIPGWSIPKGAYASSGSA